MDATSKDENHGIHGVHAKNLATALWKVFRREKGVGFYILFLYRKMSKSFEHIWKYFEIFGRTVASSDVEICSCTNKSVWQRVFDAHLDGCSRLTWLVDQIDWDQGDHVPNLRKF